VVNFVARCAVSIVVVVVARHAVTIVVNVGVRRRRWRPSRRCNCRRCRGDGRPLAAPEVSYYLININ
jgi:hypothetical protein